VLGLPPAFVLSQDQTLKFEEFGFWLPGVEWPLGSQCVTGTFTQNTRPIARSRIMVMAETQDLPEFRLLDPLPDQAAWTPPPAFLFLQIQLSKSNRCDIVIY
jgi:hypothetical protein